jgi:hypothetical protein
VLAEKHIRSIFGRIDRNVERMCKSCGADWTVRSKSISIFAFISMSTAFVTLLDPLASRISAAYSGFRLVQLN